MDYEKEYKEVFRKIVEWYNLPDVTKTEKERFCEIFPQLKESEDEKIRKEISEYIHRTTLVNFIGKCKKADAERWIAWLEKQGDINKHIQEEIEKQTTQQWKPTEEQIFYLSYVVDCFDVEHTKVIHDVLSRLLEQLKAL